MRCLFIRTKASRTAAFDIKRAVNLDPGTGELRYTGERALLDPRD